ncbi:hypothetical protein Gotri_000005, partial [Gossypium trilobum]|nr:hypothetical protein [Gossypium trilobum]
MNSVWLREEGDEDMGGISEENRGFRMGQQKMGQGKENSLTDYALNVIDHDLKDVALVVEEGKKRSRGENEDLTGKEEM